MPAPTEIIPYTAALLPAFQSLNREWIAHYFRIEAEDERELTNAEAVILGSGGQIFFALEQGAALHPQNVLGCVGVYKRQADFYEIIKLAVADAAQGRGLGRKLMAAALHFIAQQPDASRAVILTNSSLGPAMALYRSMGFVDAELGFKHLFERADTELVLPLPQKSV